MKIVYNNSFGGFQLGEQAEQLYRSRGGLFSASDLYYGSRRARSDPVLVGVVEELGDEASSCSGDLSVVEIPNGMKWGIINYDGKEWIVDRDRTWGDGYL